MIGHLGNNSSHTSVQQMNRWHGIKSKLFGTSLQFAAAGALGNNSSSVGRLRKMPNQQMIQQRIMYLTRHSSEELSRALSYHVSST